MHPIIGLIGTIIIILAFIPQIYHLVTKKCSAGISLTMYIVWNFATALILIHSLTGNDIIFKIFTTSNGIAILIITLLAIKYRNGECSIHSNNQKLS